MAEPDPVHPTLSDGVVSLRALEAEALLHSFIVLAEDGPVGQLAIQELGDAVGQLTWATDQSYQRRGFATRAVRLATDYAFGALRLDRVQAEVDARNHPALRIAARAGLRREGLLRGYRTIEGERHDRVLLARLASDPGPETQAGFIGLVNSTLPRTRLIAHVVIRDNQGRIMLAETTYKTDWELPGGVVETFESPREGAARETWEELGIELPIGKLLCVDWLPPWRGWDDAVELLFDGGIHGPELLSRLTLQPREIRRVEFCTLEQARERCLPGTHRRLVAVVGAPEGRVLYLERGAPPGSTEPIF
ncbi:GNAT family N-acetyltransferase [Actinopolymorpha pittospori]|uniref:8-oxo-dGTP pyrophosphatase MutT (NUDIX family) n=1 Tax=Actinopolymorpha pittospori TaxID=648752 RepID=A0A927N3R4_9ACTN|nr:8-oxo-dGTP pyrophosphatase MutT (NUDIX family) [Actinopolymorpha pittospori]